MKGQPINGKQATAVVVDEATRVCAICDRPIKPGLLMCAGHWRLVPQPQARQVLSTWGRFSRARSADTAHKLQALRDYRAARDSAISAVNQRLEESTT